VNMATEAVTSVRLALADVETTPGRVRLRWYGSSSTDAVVVERRSTREDWRTVGAPRREEGFLTFEDRSVLPGQRYAYRLRGRAARSEETWVEIPRNLTLALSPSLRHTAASLTLASDEPARLDVYDPGGRRVRHRELERLGPGIHEVALPEASAWKSGLYFARLDQGTQSALAKWHIVRWRKAAEPPWRPLGLPSWR